MKKESGKLGKPKRRVVPPLVRGALNAKAKGELAELAFVLKAASLGFGVAKPHGDNERYDFVVDSGQRLWKVQVKSSYTFHRRGYQVGAGGNGQKTYKADEIDFLVGYIAPRNIWYVVPVNCILLLRTLWLYPFGCRSGGRFECYREAWHLMAAQTTAASTSIHPIKR